MFIDRLLLGSPDIRPSFELRPGRPENKFDGANVAAGEVALPGENGPPLAPPPPLPTTGDGEDVV